MDLEKKCWNCTHWCVCESICKAGMSIGLCSSNLKKWDGWISKDTPPENDEYVLIQLAKDWAGDADNVCIGMYIPEFKKWYIGHITLSEELPEHIYAWRKLPNSIKEK